MVKVQCPFCKGKGFTKFTQKVRIRKYSDKERKKAFDLRRKGYSYREIGRVLGIEGSSAQKVKSLIDVYYKHMIDKGAYLAPEPKEATKYYKNLK